MKIFAGRSNRTLAEAICKSIDVPLGKVLLRDFPNGETFARIEENVRGEDTYIVQSTCPPVNQNMMELFIMIDASVAPVPTESPPCCRFYGYARQDRKDQPRVPISAKLVANLLVSAGANRVLTVDLHAQQIQGFFDIPVDHLYAAPVMFEYLKTMDLGEQIAVVSPDVGGIKMAHAYSQLLHADLAIVAKRRMSDTEIETVSVIGKVRDKTVVLVDDLTETAGTLVSAAKILRRRGAKRIIAVVSHAVLNDLGIKRLRKSNIDELITTDTVPRPPIEGVKLTTCSVAGLLGEGYQADSYEFLGDLAV